MNQRPGSSSISDTIFKEPLTPPAEPADNAPADENNGADLDTGRELAVFPRQVMLNIRLSSTDKGEDMARHLGVRLESELSDEAFELVNEGWIKMMKELGIKQLRPGIGDTGYPVFSRPDPSDKSGEKRVQVPVTNLKVNLFLNDLLEAGYVLVSAWWRFEPIHRQGKPTGKSRVLIRFVFSCDQQIEKKMPDGYLERLRDFLRVTAFGQGFIFENPNSTDTVNLNSPWLCGDNANVLRFVHTYDSVAANAPGIRDHNYEFYSER